MGYEVEDAIPRGRPKKTWIEVVQKNCQAHKLNREDAMDCSRWRKQWLAPHLMALRYAMYVLRMMS